MLDRRYWHYFAVARYLPAADIDSHIGETKYLVHEAARPAGQNGATGAGTFVHTEQFPLVIDYDYLIHVHHAPFSVRSVVIVVPSCRNSEFCHRPMVVAR